MRRILLLGVVFFNLTAIHAELIQHLNAGIQGSVLRDSTNLVSEWTDQSGAGNNAITSAGKVFYDSLETEEQKAWLDFGDSANSMQLFTAGGSDTWLDQSAGSAGFCVILAFKINSVNSNWNDLIGNSSLVGSGFGLRYGDNGRIQGYLSGNTINKGGSYLAAGDKVVYAFNYNAATGYYEFWDSKNGNSVSGTVTNTDFSLIDPVTLGATTQDGRSFNGWVGEVKIYNDYLSPSLFQSERDSMAMKWAGFTIPLGLKWRVIPEDPDFPTEDLLLAAISVTDSGFSNPLPADPGNSDCTPTFQEALDLVGAEGGGTVFIPEGHYHLDGSLYIPGNVTLRGRWRALSESDSAAGTIIKIYGGHGVEEGTPFITIDNSGGVRDLAFWYPEQNPDNIVPYPFVMEPDGGPITIENVTLINAYKGVNMSSASMCFIDNVQGTALHTGFFADRSYAVSRFDKLIFAPEFWRWAKLGENPVSDEYESFMMSQGIGIDIREMDGFHLTECKIRGMQTGLSFDIGVTGDNPHGDIGGLDFRNCEVALKIGSAKSIKIVNSYLEGTIIGLQNLYGKCNLKVNNCTIIGPSYSVDNRIGGSLNLSSCILNGKLSSSGNLQVTGCSFLNTGTDIELGTGIESALIYGSEYADGPNIINNSPSSATVIIDHDLTDNRYSPAAVLPAKNMGIVRKPAKNDLFNIIDYGAVPNDGIDDSDAFEQAITAANANSGGIVFIPYGAYDISGSYTLAPGVELRGINGSRHNAKNPGPGSMIQVRGNEGNTDGPAFLNLGAGCGIRGLVFYYPSQKASMLVPETIIAYPFTIRGTGDNIYVTDCQLTNPYQAINFYEADHHLVENCLLGGLNKTIYVQNCDSGRVENFHLKPDFWRDLGIGDYPKTGEGTSQLKRYCGKYLHGIWLENSTNQVVYNIFNHASHQFFRADNSTGIGFMIGGEQLQRGYRFSGSENFSLVLSNSNINNQGDRSGAYGCWTDANFTGVVNTWMCGVEGTADKAFWIKSGEFLTRQNSIGGSGSRGIVNLEVDPGGTLSLNAFSFSRILTLDFDPESEVSIQESNFHDGIPNVLFRDTNVVLERNLFHESYAVTDVNQNWFVNQGLVLDSAGIEFDDSPMFGEDIYDARRIKGARTTLGGYSIDATDNDFLNGSNNLIDISTYYRIDTDCKIDVYYNSRTGRKLGKSYSYSGLAAPAYKSVNFTVSDALFTGDEDIYIKITGDSPMLNYVSISRQIKVLNLPPEWSADTLYFPDATPGSQYSESIEIGSDIFDPENDALSFAKFSGPSWLSVSSSGTLSGTPDNSNAGVNSIIVQASDGNGNKVNVTLLIIVENSTGISPVHGDRVTVYPLPVQNELSIAGIKGNIKYQIYTMSGYKIMEGQIDDNTIRTHHLPPGTYLLKIEDVVLRISKI